MENTFNDFLNYCGAHGIILTRDQTKIAKEFFDLPKAGGKSTLASLLYTYDPVAYRVTNDLNKRFAKHTYRSIAVG